MPQYRYASAPSSISIAPIVTTIAGAITNLVPRYFWYSYRTRSGYSVHSPSTLAIASSGYRIIIPATLRPAGINDVFGHDILEYVIHGNIIDDPTTSVILATFPEYDALGNRQALPAQIDLTTDQQVEVGAGLILASPSDLPLIPVHGMRRTIINPSQFLAYDAVFPPIGWKPAYPPQHTVYLASNEVQYGMNQEIDAILDEQIVVTQKYAVDGSLSKPVKLWIVNSEPTPVPQGTPIGLAIEIDGNDFSDRFVGLIELQFDGFVDTNTCLLDISDMVVNVLISYQGNRTNLILQKNLPPNMAVQLSIFLKFNPFQLNNKIANGTTIRFAPYFFTDFAVFTPIAGILGSFIANEFDLRRIVPNGPNLFPIALKGSGIITLGDGNGGYAFFGVPEAPVAGLLPNTVGQEVFMNINGDCFTSITPQVGTALRAIVGTQNGQGQMVQVATGISVNNTTLLSLTIVYPVAIRGDYPDVIANNNKGKLNATAVRIKMRGATVNTVREYPIIPQTVSQTFTLGSGGIPVTDAPVPDPAFGLYAVNPASVTIVSQTGASFFVTDTISISIAFQYQDTVTSISHSFASGCMYEATSTIASIFEAQRYFAPPLNNDIEFRNLPIEQLISGQLRWNRANNRYYVFTPNSLEPDTGLLSSNSYKPASYPVSQPGRWLFMIDSFAPQLRFFREPLSDATAFQTLPSSLIFDGQQRVNLANGRIYVMRFNHTPTVGYDEIPSTIANAFWVWAGGGLNETFALVNAKVDALQAHYLGSFPTANAIRSRTQPVADGAILTLASNSKLYVWNSASTEVDDSSSNPLVIAQSSPTTGRWIQLRDNASLADPLPTANHFRQIDSAFLVNGQIRINLANNRLYQYSTTSVGIDDSSANSLYLKPITVTTGRWVMIGGENLIDLVTALRSPFADASAFRAFSHIGIPHGQMALNLDTNQLFRYDTNSTISDDGTPTTPVIKPNSLPSANAGRWMQVGGSAPASASTVTRFTTPPSTITPATSRSLFFSDNRIGGSLYIAKQSIAGSLYEFLPFKLLDAITIDPISGAVVTDPIAGTIVYDETIHYEGTGNF